MPVDRRSEPPVTVNRSYAGAASSAQTFLPADPGVRTTPQSRQSRWTMNMPWPPGRPARCGVRGAGWPVPRSVTSSRSTLALHETRSPSGPSACRQALVTSSETTSRTSSAAARRSAVAAGSQPQSYSAWRVKSRASGTIPLAPPGRASVRRPPVGLRGGRSRVARLGAEVARLRLPGGAHQRFTSPIHRFTNLRVHPYRECRILCGLPGSSAPNRDNTPQRAEW